MNSHGIADFAHELQAVCADQLPACILSQTGLAVPVPPGLVLPAFSTEGYVRETETLVYVDQDAHTVTLLGADGTSWLALATDTWTAYAQWTTEAGTHYRWRPSATQPADVAGLLTFASVTIAGGAITAVTPLASVTRAAAGRALLGLGTMATQHADAVAITGGTATLASPLTITGTAPSAFGGTVQATRAGLGDVPQTDRRLHITYLRASEHGIVLRPDADSGNYACMFQNGAQAFVGGISTSATATSYGTSSDVRLKHSIAALTEALERVLALRPVSFRWNADDSHDEGFLAHELMQQIPRAVTGEPDALNDDGSVKPQQIDHAKIVVWLCGAVQELAARVQALETALGV